MASLLAGCGQKGPLFLPNKPAPSATAVIAPAPLPASSASDTLTNPASK
ncbi:MAG: lipoprotein [Herminiimonas sp.]|nr:lipoprotein [Herminiimonas sp.]